MGQFAANPTSAPAPAQVGEDGGLLPPTSRASRLVAGAVGVGIGLLAIVTIGAVLTRADQPYWMVVGFEVVALGASAFALLIARGRFRDGPGMALLCVAGALFVAGVLGYYSTKSTPGAPAQLLLHGRAVAMKPWALLHTATAGILALLAAYEVLRRNTRSMYYLARAAMSGAPLAALFAVGLVLYRKSQAAQTAYEATAEAALSKALLPPPPPAPFLPPWVTWLGGSLGAIVALVLFCACAHCVIRAFEMGRPRA